MVLRTPFTNSSRLLGGVLLGQLHRFDEHDGHGDVGRAVNSQVASRNGSVHHRHGIERQPTAAL
jgi:hypothetical protein